MDYKLISRPIPGKPELPVKFYASIVRPKNVSLDMLAKRISEVSPVNELDTQTALVAFTKILPEFLKEGATVELGDLGRFRVNISSDGAESEEDFKKEMIKSNKISYQASVKVKKEMKNVEYTKVQ
ncbi:hypothetical protein [Saccharicrinis aurantiacus]|uniref:HU family DNA-binding protein n=1 Tax=Saccharicrinis aurantiacus TaxID=1849719 RepID=UPI00249273B5|nr:hypothetical protein [Saccharicrinis aurantiacus]